MSRVFVKSPEAQRLMEEYLIPGYLKYGSVRALTGELCAKSSEPIYANRLLTLFSDSEDSALNPASFEAISEAAKKLDLSGWERQGHEVYSEDPRPVRRFLDKLSGRRKDVPREALQELVQASNNLRSCRSEADGFVSGKRRYNLKEAEDRHTKALLALADWAEEMAREQLGERPVEL